MNLKHKIVLSGLIFLIFLTSTKVYSQDSELGYLMNRDVYFQTQQSYLSAKRAFLNKETLERKAILFQDLRAFLYARNRLMNSYLSLLIENIESYLSAENLDKIRNWQEWLSQNEKDINQVTGSENLDQLYQRSADLDEIYPQMETDIYLGLAEVIYVRHQEIIDQIETISGDLEELTEEDSWVMEVNAKIEESKVFKQEAMNVIENTRVRRSGDIRRGWDSSQRYFNQSEDSLRVALEFIDEVIKRIE